MSRRLACFLVVLALAAPAAAQSTPKRLPLRDTADAFVSALEQQLVETADAMPSEKYGFAPTGGEFKGVRTFAQQVKHLAATNYIIAAGILEQAPPADAGNETGPENVRTKAEILTYLRGSFAALHKAVAKIDDQNAIIKPSPISPLGDKTTRLGLAQEALIHVYDHYGQMVIYLRMNGIVPPASR
jgi:uncharacterized damage-inducible protein DinB